MRLEASMDELGVVSRWKESGGDSCYRSLPFALAFGAREVWWH